MENNTISIRINLEQREFEVKGDSKYVDQRFGKNIDEYMAIIKSGKSGIMTKGQSSTEAITNDETNGVENTSKDIPEAFGEYLNRFPKGLSSVDKLLIASYFVQCHSKEKSFTVSEASNLLVEQGIKLSNASAFNTSSLSSKRIFKLSGKSFRVSESGVEHLQSM